MSEHILQIPAPIENGMMIPTLDGQGWIWLYKNEITKSYIDYAAETEGLMLEIGAGYGHIILEVLKKGARVIAVEISQDQLEIIKNRVTESGLSGLKAIRAEFPEELDLPENTIDRVLISRLFFHRGEDKGEPSEGLRMAKTGRQGFYSCRLGLQDDIQRAYSPI